MCYPGPAIFCFFDAVQFHIFLFPEIPFSPLEFCLILFYNKLVISNDFASSNVQPYKRSAALFQKIRFSSSYPLKTIGFKSNSSKNAAQK